MRAKSSLRLVLLGALSGLVMQAHAQDATPGGNAPAEADPPSIELYTPADADAVLDARILALKTVLRLTPEQQKLWTPVETAIREIAKRSAERRGERAAAPPPASFVDILERSADAEIVRAQDLKTVVSALKPLAGSLSPEQRRRIPAFLGMRENANGMPQPTAELWIFEEEQ
ncbi:Spy/CpxP family protein refolding chaperone [Bradyrhizobium canariense]|uniref:Zinc resistance-associated protein n=1 Tax=Bradyrhizobium canariense TaxID=255045 RepID=A0A1H1WMS6_9BRAD|nr:Spy/CpxP family protein refolding chaperone [Bradyrhizobium canariense]SDS98618.1 zinc resistance-associated protein [Bradyrhizobium canariense]